MTASAALALASLVPALAQAQDADPKAVVALLQKHSCVACHGFDNKIVGPGYKQVATKYADRKDAVSYLAAKIKSGGSGVWGPVPMPPQSLPEADAQAIAAWVSQGAVKP